MNIITIALWIASLLHISNADIIMKCYPWQEFMRAHSLPPPAASGSQYGAPVAPTSSMYHSPNQPPAAAANSIATAEQVAYTSPPPSPLSAYEADKTADAPQPPPKEDKLDTYFQKQAPVAAATTEIEPIAGGMKGSAATTRYWDCCKPSCSWEGKGWPWGQMCVVDGKGKRVLDQMKKSGCEGEGDVYVDPKQQPFAVNDQLSYGFIASTVIGKKEQEVCGRCMQLTFKECEIEGKYQKCDITGKQMVAMITNIGYDLKSEHFDLQIPGAGFGAFKDGCPKQFPQHPGPLWGNPGGGVASIDECKNLPEVLQPGCKWRFEWFKNANNPTVDYQEVKCPSALIEIARGSS